MNKKHWFDWFDRVRFTYITACGALIFGAVYPWYKIPPLAMAAFEIRDITISSIGRVLAALLAGLCFYLIWQQKKQRRNHRVLRIIFWSSLFITLLFPYTIMTWHPKVAFVATSSYAQQARITRDIEESFSEVQAQWKQGISLSRDIEPESIFSLEITDSTFFQLPSWYLIFINGFGYSTSFFTLIAHGWGMAIVGSSISLIALYLSIAKNRFEILLEDLSLVLPWSGVIIISIFISILSFNIANYQLNVLFAKGEYQKVLEISQNLEAWYPPLSGDMRFLNRKGKAGFYALSPNEAQINFVKGLAYLRLGDYVKAELFFQNSIDLQPNQFLIKAFLFSSIINQGVDDFNNQKHSSAIKHFQKSLTIIPGNLEALYNLMISTAINGDFEQSGTVAKMIIDNQKYFQLPSLSILGQAYIHLTWNSYQDNNLNESWQQYRKSLDPKTWEK